MHFLELLEQVSDRDTAVYYAENCDEAAPKARYSASETLIHGGYSFAWAGTKQGYEFWEKIHEKLSTHPQNQKVTYELNVYEQYKNEVFEDVKAVIPNIRDYSVIIKDTSIEDRQKLHSLLHCLDEPVSKTAGLITNRNVDFSYFRLDEYEVEWAMAREVGDNKQAITIQDFISKFSKPNTIAPEEDIKVGEVYTNSAGFECIIAEVNTNGSIRYLHKDGNYYTIGANVIAANWTKKPASVESYAIHITDTSLENRLKVKDLLVKLKEPVFLKSRAFSENKIYGKAYLAKLSYEWVVKDEEYARKNKTIVTIEEFIELFGAKQKQEETTKMKHICELLEELFDKETAIKFANNAIKDPRLFNKVLTEKNAINSLLWERTPEGDVFWRVIHRQLSATDKVSMCMDTFKEYASKDVQHALETKQTKTTKKETFMSKLKTTTLNTLEQNKQAAIIAAKVDAGRIINKQVIKQLKPHVPMLLRGYLDTPLAPVIAANVVAMIGNHTDNSKVKKVSELMLLGAADATVQSFNLDKIIDDVLAGIKLPAGFLSADDN